MTADRRVTEAFDDVGRQANKMREQGHTWTQVAEDLDVSPSAARRLVSSYREQTDVAAARHQLALFDKADL